jgi:DNA-directed RNA polymerase
MTLWKDRTPSEKSRLLSIQLANEEQILDLSLAHYVANHYRDPSAGTPEKQLTIELIGVIAEAILEYLNALPHKSSPSFRPIVELGPFNVAQIMIMSSYATLVSGLGVVNKGNGSNRDVKYGRVLQSEFIRQSVGELCRTAEYSLSQKEHRKDWNYVSGIVKQWTPRAIKKFLGKYPPSQSVKLTVKERANLGLHLCKILEMAGIIVKTLVPDTSVSSIKRVVNVLTFSEEVSNGLTIAHSHFMENCAMKYRPMIVPPIPHKIGETGGALLVQLRKGAVDRAEIYFSDGEISTRYRESVPSQVTVDGLNKLMATEWAVNDKVLEVMDEMFKSSLGYGNIPALEKDEIILSSTKCASEDKDDIRAFKLSKRLAYDRWFERGNDRVRTFLRLRIARDLVKAKCTFFHVYTCDFRGRAYATTDLLSPQSGDHDRSLILFANTIPQTDRGMYWLKVHTANCFDQDKVSFDDRVRWVDDNIKMLSLINEDPLGNLKLWASSEEDRIKKDKSFQKLAAVFELFRKDGMTQLPIQMDGSCNGIQWWAAVTRDEHVGRKVNLLPCDRPEDIYLDVANKCFDIVSTPTDPWHYSFASIYDTPKKWRKVVKRSVMTDPYGVTVQGIKKALISDGFVTGFHDSATAATNLTRIICTAKDSVLVTANAYKKWLRDASDVIIASCNHPNWITPSGFLVKQEYRPKVTAKFTIGNKRSSRTQGEPVSTVVLASYDKNGFDRGGAKNGISPNVIHSFDSSHMFLTIEGMGDITEYCFIHDSFGTHGPNIDMMRRVTREQFVLIHQEPLFEKLKTEWETRYNITLDPLPPRGDLDINQVLESEYFFH